ncbi:hypothetical protein AAG612_03060 [Citromicrobium bathyomarinum]|uniref:hypothetical protein n=1 Tax=Citromicrobium bathyomarinum TaxID=72174 RepID=UPI003159A1C8
MIALATGQPAFRQDGDYTILSVPSGDGAPIEIAFSKNQVVYLSREAADAVQEAFSTMPIAAELIPMVR